MNRNIFGFAFATALLATAFAARPAHAILQCTDPKICSFYNMPIYDQLHPSLLSIQVPQNIWDLGQETSTRPGTWIFPGGSALCGPTAAAMVHRAAYLHKDFTTKISGWTQTDFTDPAISPEVATYWQLDPNAPKMDQKELQRLINMSIKQSYYNGHAAVYGGGGTASRQQAGDFWHLTPKVTGVTPGGQLKTTFIDSPAATGISCGQYLGAFDNGQFINFIKQGAATVIAHNSFPEVITTRAGGQFEFHDFTTVTDSNGNSGQSVGGHILAVNGFTRLQGPQYPVWKDFLQIFDPWGAQKFSVSLYTKRAGTIIQGNKFITTVLPNPIMAVFSQSPNNDPVNHPTWNAIYQFVACFDTTQVL